MAKTYRSKGAMEENLKRLYANIPHDKVTIEEAVAIWERDPSDVEKNRMWFSTLLSHLTHHKLVRPAYIMRNSRKTLEGIRLTSEGKRVLGREDDVESSLSQNTTMIMNQPKETDLMKTIMKLIAEYRAIHPEFDVNIDVKLKENWEEYIAK